MKNEQLLQMLGEIDEKHLREANKDVELWLEEQNEVKFTVERPRKSSPWKIVTAAACSAAALFGVFAMVSNVGKLRGGIYSDSAAAPNSALSERPEDYKIENLDYANAVVTENVPISGQWRRLMYKNLRFGEKSADKLVKIAADYGVTIDKNDIMLGTVKYTIDTKPLSETDLAQYDHLMHTADYPFDGMFYCSDDLYIETTPHIGNWIELNNNKNLSSVLGIENKDFGPWRPGIGPGIGVASEQYVDPNDETATCVLDGKTVKVADALRNALKIISESDVFPKGFDTEVRNNIGLYTYENGNQALWIDITYTLDGVTYMSPSPHYIDVSRDIDRDYSVHFHCGMLTENTIDWIWSTDFDGETEVMSRDCEINISREDALKLVSFKLDRDDMFTVSEIQLVYADRRVSGGNALCIEPTWMFCLSNNDSPKQEKQYAYVSAVDGTVQIFEQYV